MNTGKVVGVRMRVFLLPSTRLEHLGPQGYTASYQIVQEAVGLTWVSPAASV